MIACPTVEKAGLYIHIPFCVRKCPYCDFNSYATDHQTSKFTEHSRRYVDALIAEYHYYLTSEVAPAVEGKEEEPVGPWGSFEYDTIFLGGGTPSLLPVEELTRLLRTLRDSQRNANDAEITFEANPGTINESLGLEKLTAAVEAGFNRISFGSQSFSKRKLEALGRIHLVEDNYRAVELARSAGFNNLNLDLIYGVKDETRQELDFDLAQLFSLKPEHISAYCLTIEPGTEFGKLKARGIEVSSEEDFQSDAYLHVLQELETHGYQQYEVSNFSKPEKVCAHNLGYWSGKAYLGLGAGAASYLPTSAPFLPSSARVAARWINLPGPEHYIASVLEKRHARQTLDSITRSRAVNEFLFLRLRRNSGFNEQEFFQQFGEPLADQLLEELNKLTAGGLLGNRNGQYSLTANGFLFSNTVFERLVDSLR